MEVKRLICRAPVMAEDGEAIYALLAQHWEGIDEVCHPRHRPCGCKMPTHTR